MTKDIFVKLDIKKQVEIINNKTITGLNIIEVAKGIGMSESAIRRIMKKNDYTFNRVEKIYLLSSNNIAITKEDPKGKSLNQKSDEVLSPTNTNNDPEKNNEGIRVEERNNSYFTKEEVKGLKELLLSIGGITAVSYTHLTLPTIYSV